MPHSYSNDYLRRGKIQFYKLDLLNHPIIVTCSRDRTRATSFAGDRLILYSVASRVSCGEKNKEKFGLENTQEFSKGAFSVASASLSLSCFDSNFTDKLFGLVLLHSKKITEKKIEHQVFLCAKVRRTGLRSKKAHHL